MSVPTVDERLDALDPGAERRLPPPIPMTAESDARFHVIWCQDVQVTASGTFEPEGAAP